MASRGLGRLPRPSPLLVLSLLLAAARSCSAAMAAWWTDLGAQVVMQNETTGGLMYSLCNSNSTPVFPDDPPQYFSLAFQPRNGTALAGTGWWDTTTTWVSIPRRPPPPSPLVELRLPHPCSNHPLPPQDEGASAHARPRQASFFYQDYKGDIVNSYQKCDFATGQFVSQNVDTVISDGMPSVNSDTGLAAVLLGSTQGYRVFAHDDEMHVHQIQYSNGLAAWDYAGVVSEDKPASNSLAAAFTSKGNVSVSVPKGQSDVEVMRANSDDKWWLCESPIPCPPRPPLWAAPLGSPNERPWASMLTVIFKTTQLVSLSPWLAT